MLSNNINKSYNQSSALIRVILFIVTHTQKERVREKGDILTKNWSHRASQSVGSLIFWSQPGEGRQSLYSTEL